MTSAPFPLSPVNSLRRELLRRSAALSLLPATMATSWGTTLEGQGWEICELADQDHGVCMAPQLVVPPVRAFLDGALP